MGTNRFSFSYRFGKSDELTKDAKKRTTRKVAKPQRRVTIEDIPELENQPKMTEPAPVAGQLLRVAAAHGRHPRAFEPARGQVVDHAHEADPYDPNSYHCANSLLCRALWLCPFFLACSFCTVFTPFFAPVTLGSDAFGGGSARHLAYWEPTGVQLLGAAGTQGPPFGSKNPSAGPSTSWDRPGRTWKDTPRQENW